MSSRRSYFIEKAGDQKIGEETIDEETNGEQLTFSHLVVSFGSKPSKACVDLYFYVLSKPRSKWDSEKNLFKADEIGMVGRIYEGLSSPSLLFVWVGWNRDKQ